MPTLTEILNSINLKKEKDLINEYNNSDYVPFLINRAFSYFPETVLIANNMNMNSHIEKEMQYKYYLYKVKKKKRFSSWFKKETNKNIELIKEYYNVSTQKAEEMISLLTENNLKEIQKKLDKGGIRK